MRHLWRFVKGVCIAAIILGVAGVAGSAVLAHLATTTLEHGLVAFAGALLTIVGTAGATIVHYFVLPTIQIR